MRLARDQIVDRYRVDTLLGEGGAAEVYRVHHTTLGTVHALKVLSLAGESVKRRMLREGRLQASLRHPNVVSVSDVIEVGDSIGLLMEYVRGPDVSQVLEACRPTLDEALAIFRGVVAGLGHAHAQGMIHRDLKASNVMLASGEHPIVPKVTDFGLAKALDDVASAHRTRTGVTMGTPAYMAPEQIVDASRVDRRSDLWSLGCLLYELVTGRRAFDAPDVVSLFNRVTLGAYTPIVDVVPGCPDRVVRLVDALLTVDVQRRVGDCAAIVAWLDGAPTLPESGAALGALGGAPPVENAGVCWLEVDGPTGRVVQELAGRPLSNSSTLAPRTPSAPGPTPLTDERYHPYPVAAPAPVRPRSWVPAAIGAAGLGAVLLALWAWSAPDVPPPIPIAVRPPAPEPPEPVPEPVPVPAPEPAPTVRPAPASPVPHATLPTPVEPAPAPAPEPPAPGRVVFTGVDAVVLVADDGATVPGPSVAPGHYRILARFPPGADEIVAGEVTVAPGAEVHVTCVSQMRRCVAR